MCTAATYKTADFHFGRTLDYEFSYGDEVAVTPRNDPFHFTEKGDINTHYPMIGMAYVAENYPLYYDAANEKGLGMAGLNFVGNAVCKDSEESITVEAVEEGVKVYDNPVGVLTNNPPFEEQIWKKK